MAFSNNLFLIHYFLLRILTKDITMVKYKHCCFNMNFVFFLAEVFQGRHRYLHMSPSLGLFAEDKRHYKKYISYIFNVCIEILTTDVRGSKTRMMHKAGCQSYNCKYYIRLIPNLGNGFRSI